MLLEGVDVTPAAINGIVTTEEFAQENWEKILIIIRVWFQIIGYMEGDLPIRSEEFLKYLNSVASVQYTPKQYVFAWENMEVFFNSPESVQKEVFNQDGSFYWKQIWESINTFLLDQGDLKESVPTSAFWGLKIQESLKNGIENSHPETSYLMIDRKQGIKKLSLKPGVKLSILPIKH